jgi:TetR/AcrR family transcriptional regulator, tetracycline repressor protein
VVDGALALADRSGLQALTIRKLATDLGVTPMALYWHFHDGKDELLDGLVERLWSEMDLAVDRSAPWTEQIRWLFESLLAVLRAHPAAPELLSRSKRPAEVSLNVMELGLDILRTAGFSPEDASFAARSALWTAITLVMSEPGIESLDNAERAELQRKKQIALATQSPAKFPRVVECAQPMTACDNPEEHYRFGTDLFIGGLAAVAAARAGAGEPPSDWRQKQARAGELA